MSTQSVLIIDDCENFRMVASNILLDAGFVVEEVSCPHDAFELIRREKFDIILCDLHMPFMNGEEGNEFQTSYQVGIMTVNELQALFPETPVFALTSTDPLDLERIKRSLKGIRTFAKPSNKRELFEIVEKAQEFSQYAGSLQ